MKDDLPFRGAYCIYLQGKQYVHKQTNKHTNSVALSPQANYTD
jgi:hypothetical protein